MSKKYTFFTVVLVLFLAPCCLAACACGDGFECSRQDADFPAEEKESAVTLDSNDINKELFNNMPKDVEGDFKLLGKTFERLQNQEVTDADLEGLNALMQKIYMVDIPLMIDSSSKNVNALVSGLVKNVLELIINELCKDFCTAHTIEPCIAFDEKQIRFFFA